MVGCYLAHDVQENIIKNIIYKITCLANYPVTALCAFSTCIKWRHLQFQAGIHTNELSKIHDTICVLCMLFFCQKIIAFALVWLTVTSRPFYVVCGPKRLYTTALAWLWEGRKGDGTGRGREWKLNGKEQGKRKGSEVGEYTNLSF